MDTDLTVALRIDNGSETGREAVRLSQEISLVCPVLFQLNSQGTIHVSVFQGRFPAETIDEVRQIVKGFSRAIVARMQERLFLRPNGNIFWNLEHNVAIAALHKECLKVLRPMTGGRLMKQFSDILGAGASEKNSQLIKKWGFLLADDEFLPHVTLCRLSDLTDQAFTEQIKVQPVDLGLHDLILGEIDYSGNIVKVI